MGSRNSKPADKKIEVLEQESKILEQGIQTIQTTLTDLSHDLPSKTELDDKISRVKQDQVFNCHRLQQLLEINKEQQSVIQDLDAKYSQLNDNYIKQQARFTDITKEYEEKLSRYEENLNDAKCKLTEVELSLINNSEFMTVLGIRKTANMISKTNFEPKFSAGKTTTGSKSQAQDPRSMSRQKLQQARDRRIMERQSSNKTQRDLSICTEIVHTPVIRRFNPDLEDAMSKERLVSGVSSPKGTLYEVDLNEL